MRLGWLGAEPLLSSGAATEAVPSLAQRAADASSLLREGALGGWLASAAGKQLAARAQVASPPSGASSMAGAVHACSMLLIAGSCLWYCYLWQCELRLRRRELMLRGGANAVKLGLGAIDTLLGSYAQLRRSSAHARLHAPRAELAPALDEARRLRAQPRRSVESPRSRCEGR